MSPKARWNIEIASRNFPRIELILAYNCFTFYSKLLQHTTILHSNLYHSKHESSFGMSSQILVPLDPITFYIQISTIQSTNRDLAYVITNISSSLVGDKLNVLHLDLSTPWSNKLSTFINIFIAILFHTLYWKILGQPFWRWVKRKNEGNEKCFYALKLY